MYRGVLGYGSHQELHHHHLVHHDDPILISIIDRAERIDELLAALDHMISDSCLITIAEVTVVTYASPAPRGPAPVPPGPLPPADGLEIGASANVLATSAGQRRRADVTSVRALAALWLGLALVATLLAI